MRRGVTRTRLMLPLVAAGCLILLSCRTTGSFQPVRPQAANPPGPYVQSASGMTFPENVGSFQRVNIVRYDATGEDVSAGYNLVNPAHQVVMTVYIYPIPEMVSLSLLPPSAKRERLPGIESNHFAAVKDQIEKRCVGARVVGDETVSLAQGVRMHEGRKATYECDAMPDITSEQCLTHVYLFSHGKWFIKYRITHVKASRQAVEYEIGQFMKLLEWP